MKIRKEKLGDGDNLPKLRIRSIKEVQSVELTMDVDDKVMEELVAYGRKVATKEDYFRIAFHKALVDSLEEMEKSKPKRRQR